VNAAVAVRAEAVSAQIASAAPALTVDRVSVAYGEFRALQDLTFAAAGSAVHALIGPNGAGKSTLLDVMTGFHPPVSGAVHFRGHKISALAPFKVARLGIRRTFQRPRLSWDWSLTENVAIGADPALTPAVRLDKAYVALRKVGLGARAEQRARDSDGVTQLRAQVARCIVADPHVLMLDEPSAGMDDGQRGELGALLQELTASAVTVLLVAHDLALIRRCASRVTVLASGELIADGGVSEVLDRDEVRRVYLGGDTDE
jgi:ABC-type branched-subunit amino acid transport system ATPase component